MPFTNPITWVAGALVTASQLNQQIRDNENALAARAIAVSFGDFAGAALTTGIRGYIRVPVAVTLTGWTAIGDSSSGSIQLDVWKAANAVPTSSGTIVGTDPPLISGAQMAQHLALPAWTTSVAVGDVLAFKINSVTTFKAVTLTLDCTQA